MDGDELVLGDAVLGRDGDRVVLPLAPEELLGCRDREHDEADRPEAVDLAVLRDSDELERTLRLQRRDSTVSPTPYPCSSAVPASMTTSFAADGHRPSNSWSGLNRAISGDVSIPNPSVGHPSELTASPSGVRTFVFCSSSTLPVASATPSAPRTVSSTDSSTGGLGGFSPSTEMSRPFPVTTASVPAYESTRRFVNARWTVSVRM